MLPTKDCGPTADGPSKLSTLKFIFQTVFFFLLHSQKSYVSPEAPNTLLLGALLLLCAPKKDKIFLLQLKLFLHIGQVGRSSSSPSVSSKWDSTCSRRKSSKTLFFVQFWCGEELYNCNFLTRLIWCRCISASCCNNFFSPFSRTPECQNGFSLCL